MKFEQSAMAIAPESPGRPTFWPVGEAYGIIFFALTLAIDDAEIVTGQAPLADPLRSVVQRATRQQREL